MEICEAISEFSLLHQDHINCNAVRGHSISQGLTIKKINKKMVTNNVVNYTSLESTRLVPAHLRDLVSFDTNGCIDSRIMQCYRTALPKINKKTVNNVLDHTSPRSIKLVRAHL